MEKIKPFTITYPRPTRIYLRKNRAGIELRDKPSHVVMSFGYFGPVCLRLALQHLTSHCKHNAKLLRTH